MDPNISATQKAGAASTSGTRRSGSLGIGGALEEPSPAASVAADIIRAARMNFGFIEVMASGARGTRMRLHHTFTATDLPATLPQQEEVLANAGVQLAIRLFCAMYGQADAVFLIRVQHGELRHLEVEIGIAA